MWYQEDSHVANPIVTLPHDSLHGDLVATATRQRSYGSYVAHPRMYCLGQIYAVGRAYMS